MKVRVNGRVYECVGVAALASLCNFTRHNIRRLEDTGVLPMANIRIESHSHIPGKRRLYTIELAEKVAEIFRNENLQRPQKRDPKTAILIRQAFEEEARRLNEPNHA